MDVDESPRSERGGRAFIVLDGAELQLELAWRGWSRSELGRAAGLSAPTVRAALGGRPVAMTTWRRIAEALQQYPPLLGSKRLVLEWRRCAPRADGPVIHVPESV